MEFAQPEFLILLFAVPILGVWEYWRMYRRDTGLQFSSVSVARYLPRTIWTRLTWLLPVLRMTIVTLGILALARPQEYNVEREVVAAGVDIMLVLDLSSSMLAEDMQPNRFEATRQVAREFIDARTSDRVGITVFAGRAYTQAPLTLDYTFLKQMVDDLEMGGFEDGTAIGTALATAVNRLKDSDAESKVVILLTDGENNRGEIDPLTAADVAAAMGVRVYTIGASSYGETAPFPVQHPFFGRRMMEIPVDIDENMMREVARRTGGQYFRAADTESLRNVYREIGDLEQTEFREQVYTDSLEKYPVFLWPAFLLFMLELTLSATRLRKIP